MKIKIKSKKLKEHFIYGDFSEHKSANALVILISGFSGSKELPLFKAVSPKFVKNKFSIIKFNFCNDDEDKNPKLDAPEIKDMTFGFYVSELKNIIDTLGKKYRKIILIGHSFGAVIAMSFLAKHKKYIKKTKLILWDPSLLPWDKEGMEKDFKYDAPQKIYFMNGEKISINQTFYDELIKTNTVSILHSLKGPVCIIAAENSADKDGIKYFSNVRDRKSSRLYIIKNTNHYFDGALAQKELVEKTLGFIL